LKRGRKKKKPSGKGRDRRMKKALAGPAKRTAKKLPERRAMIAAVRRRALVARGRAEKLTRRVDREANRLMLAAWPRIERSARAVSGRAVRWARWAGRRLRPVAVLGLRVLSRLERRLLRVRDLAIRAATRASGALTPQRAVCAVIIALSACLAASQFIDYRSVEIGQPGYEGLPAATPPTMDARTAGDVHAYLLVPLAAVAAALALFAAVTGRRRLGRIVLALGAVSLGVVLLIDMPAGLDASTQSTRFAGATGVLQDGFYAELAASAGLMLGGLLLSLKPRARRRRAHSKRRINWRFRPRKPRLARTQGGRRGARTKRVRKRGGRPRTKPDDGLQRPA
jgi:hypothetical protein